MGRSTETFGNRAPRPITTEEEHSIMLGESAKLIMKGSLNNEEKALLSTLSMFLTNYESEKYASKFQRSTPVSALKFLMKENGLTQRDIPGIPQSRVSAILSGKREISKSQAAILAERFKVSPMIFLYATGAEA